MKQQDVAMIIVIVFISGVLSFFVSNKLISPPKHNLKAPIVQPISSEFNLPSQKYFNGESINPTQIIHIGDNTNQTPLNGQ